MAELDTTAILQGMGVALLIAVPAGAVQTWASATSLRSAGFLASLAGYAVGGYVAATAEPRRGLTYGGLTGLVAGLVFLALSILRRSAAGDPIAWLSLPFLAMLALSSGLLGGYLAFRRSTRSVNEGTSS
jgi:putative membrane protein (TIGR04086 family)